MMSGLQRKANAAVIAGIEAKLVGLRCARHGESPKVSFDESGELQIRGCCNPLIAAAWGRLGGKAA
jgi:hypothetical protein